MEVQLKGQEGTVTLTEVQKDDEQAIVGTTNSGKRFVTLRERTRGDLPVRHPYRVYLLNGSGFRASDPSFDDAETWFLDGDGEETFTLPEGQEVKVSRDKVLSLLSATPEDELNIIASNN